MNRVDYGLEAFTYSFASCLVTSSMRSAAIVTLRVAFFGNGLMRPEIIKIIMKHYRILGKNTHIESNKLCVIVRHFLVICLQSRLTDKIGNFPIKEEANNARHRHRDVPKAQIPRR